MGCKKYVFLQPNFYLRLMNIKRKDIDALNAVITVNIEKDDYSAKVEKILSDYRKTANIPGFRKGHIPMGMIKKQYGKAVLIDEVNKLLQEALSKYINDEKLDVLGNPLPKPQDDLNWDADNFVFEFELGMAPQFDVKLKGRKAITKYNIIANDKMIKNQVDNIRKQYGKLVSKDVIEAGDEITGSFLNEEEEINANSTFSLDVVKGKANEKKFLGANIGDTVTLKTKSLFKESNDLMTYLKISKEKAEGLAVEVSFTISEINKRELADLDQELFDKLFGEGKIASVTELKERIKTDSEKQFLQQADQKLLNDVTEYLVESTKFDLPSEFLQKWMQTSGETEISLDQAKEEYEKSEKSIRYQLIEGKLIQENDLQIQFDDLKAFANDMIKAQMAQFGQLNPSEKELDDIAARILSNKDEVKRLSDQLMSQKLLELFKAEANLKDKEISYDDFVKEVYG